MDTRKRLLKEIVRVFKVIHENSAEGFIVVNREANIEFINKSYARFLKVDRKKIVGRNIMEVIPSSRALIVLQSGKEEINWKHKP